MPKRFSEKEIEKLTEEFVNGKSIKELSLIFDCTNLTISRNLKKNIGETEYKNLLNKNKKLNNSITSKRDINVKEDNLNNISKTSPANIDNEVYLNKDFQDNAFVNNDIFVEVAPFNCEIESHSQRDFSSIPILDIELPKILYLIVSTKIELETKFLKNYPAWQFLPLEDLERKTIEFHYDLKSAKSACNKDQKVIKVPNSKVLKMVSSFLISRGITRIICGENLIAL